MGLSWTLFYLILFLLDLFFFTAEGAENAEEERKRGDGSLLDAFQCNSVILREAKNLKSLQQCLECVSPIGFLFVSLKAKHLQLEFFDQSQFFYANALPLYYFCLRSIECKRKSAYPSSLILFK